MFWSSRPEAVIISPFARQEFVPSTAGKSGPARPAGVFTDLSATLPTFPGKKIESPPDLRYYPFSDAPWEVKTVIILETKRLLLRNLTDNDTENLYRMFSDPDVMAFFPSTRTRQETVEWIRRVKERYERDGYSFYGVELKTSGQLVGYCGHLLQTDIDGRDEIEVGYGFMKEHWHHGYATETAKGCLDYGFAHLNTNRIISLIRPENTPSRRVAERNGLTVEKTVQFHGFNALVYVAWSHKAD